jgi:CheY-like chemotaxis protein
VEDDANQRMSIAELLGNGGVSVTGVGTAEKALETINTQQFDCAIVDLGLPGLSGTELIERMRATRGGEDIPIIVYTGQDLSKAQERTLERMTSTIIVKGDGSSERLLEEAALFLHRTLADFPQGKKIIVQRHDASPLEGRTVLIIDDDVRNIFSLTSALEQHGMKTAFAENGREGIERLEQTPGVDVVLVDIMMPEMDGYETMRSIRRISRYEDLPLIAVTAKAMKGDREKCLEAGASDYVSKPVDIDQLLAVLRVQLGRDRVAAGNGLAEDEFRI